MKNLYFILFAFLCCFKTYGQITVKFKPDSTVGKDAQIANSFGCTTSSMTTPWEDANYDDAGEMNIYRWTLSASGCTEGLVRSLIKFSELSSIPASSVLSAKLNLFCVNSSASWGTSYFPGSPYPNSNPGWVERVSSPWDEHVVTWRTQPATTTVNRAIIPPSGARWGWNTSIDVTDLVNDILASGSNEGFMLKLQTEVYYRATIFASSDNTDTTLRPELEIVYKDACFGTTADFSATPTSCYSFNFTDLSIAKDSGMVSWKWDFGDMTYSTVKNPSHTYLDYGSYKVRLIVTDSGGCIDTIIKAININYSHFANAGRDTILCLVDGSLTTFLRGDKTGVSYSWTPNDSLSHPSSSSTYATINKPTSFILTVTNAIGCIDKDTVRINLHPQAAINATPKDTSICFATSILLNASGAVKYDWNPSAGLETPSKASTMAKINSNATYTVKGIDVNGCIGYDSVKISVTSPVVIIAYPENATGCKGTKITYNVTGAKDYKWTPSEGLSNDSIANPEHLINGYKKYIVKGVSKEGCVGFDSVFVNEYPVPIIDAFSMENIVGCKGKDIRLNATGGSYYTWSPSEYVSDRNAASVLVNPPVSIVFSVEGTNDNGCKASDTISVIFENKAKIYIPNAFTPNNDQVNDGIRIVDNCNFILSYFSIYNRWGQKVFETNNILDDWDGKYNGGDCESGVYYYIVKGKDIKGDEAMFKGDISLLR